MVSWLRGFRGPGQPFGAWDWTTPSVDKVGREEEKGWKVRGQLCPKYLHDLGPFLPLGTLGKMFLTQKTAENFFPQVPGSTFSCLSEKLCLRMGALRSIFPGEYLAGIWY